MTAPDESAKLLMQLQSFCSGGRSWKQKQKGDRKGGDSRAQAERKGEEKEFTLGQIEAGNSVPADSSNPKAVERAKGTEEEGGQREMRWQHGVRGR